jgi:hypothetical protein
MIKLSANNAGAGIEEFQWSTSEQVYPFEKDSNGSILYCKEIDLGVLPNSGAKNLAHGISSLNLDKVFRVEGLVGRGPAGNVLQLGTIRIDGYQYCIALWITSTTISVITAFNYGSYGWTSLARIIYAK